LKKRVLVISDGLVHPSLRARSDLKRLLLGMDRLECVHSGSIEALKTLPGGGFDALAVYLHRQSVSDLALNALEAFVRGGGGLFALHSASASFKIRDRWFDLLGGRFVAHGRVGPFALRRVTRGIFGGIDAFTLHDELYFHEYDRSNTVHFVADTEKGPEPQVWTRVFGEGRVCYFAPGHRAATIRHPAAGQVLKRGLYWVCRIDEEAGE